MTPQLLRILQRPDAPQFAYHRAPRIRFVGKRKDIAGIRFGQLVAIEDAVRTRHLMSGNTRSCGCLRSDMNRRRVG